MNETPTRTFGLSLAIIASVMLFSILPLMQAGWVLMIEARIQSSMGMLPQTSETPETEAIATGGNLIGASNVGLLIQIVLAIVFLIIAVMAWRGRPPQIRWIMLAAVLALTGISLWQSISTAIAPVDPGQGIDSGAAITRQMACGAVALQTLIPLYVLWYMNRAPARAFYRGKPRVETRS
ncbi:MAG: hypothetical protein IAE89_05020 [Anaerolineae bacterium]|nr:hypothetical protein [Anaerolineae bacterium]